MVLIVNDPKGVLATALDITFHGKEDTSVEIDDGTVREQYGFLELKLPMPSLASTVYQTYDKKEEENETFIDDSKTSEKKSKRENKIRIPAGKYQIPFSVELPKSIPGSFSFGKSTQGCKILQGRASRFRSNVELRQGRKHSC